MTTNVKTVVEKKPWYQSKFIWIYGLLFIASWLVNFSIVDVELSPDASWLTTILSFVAIILRAFTGKEITFTKSGLGTTTLIVLGPICLFGITATSYANGDVHENFILEQNQGLKLLCLNDVLVVNESSLQSYNNKDVFLVSPFESDLILSLSTSLKINLVESILTEIANEVRIVKLFYRYENTSTVNFLHRWQNELYQQKEMVRLKNEAIKYKRNYNFTNNGVRLLQHKFDC